jgi:hypothetical protein
VVVRPWFAVAVVVGVVSAAGMLEPGVADAAPVLTVTATPSTALVDGQTVHVEGDGYAPSSIFEIFECAGDSVDEHRCDPRNAFDVDSDPAGHIEFDFPVDARIYLGPDGTTSYDCRTEATGCRLGVGLILEHHNSGFAVLDFEPGAPLLAPVSATATPSTGLTDGQAVSVRGEHLSDLEGAWVLQCRTDGAPRACDLDRAVQMKPNPDGTIATNLLVHRAFRSPLGDDVDCAASAGACSVVVSWGFAFVPDRYAQVPLAFAAAPPASTAPPSTPPTEPPVTAAELPRTGASSATMGALLLVGIVLVLLGALAVVAVRRGSARSRAQTG